MSPGRPAETANESERRRWNDPYWTAIWPRREPLTTAVTDYLVRHLAPTEGERILDVGSGGGPQALAIAARVGAGEVLGADISEALVALAAERAREAGAGNVTYVVADVQSDDVPGAPYDAAASQFGVMFFDEPVRAFANIRRVVRDGGRLAFACWQSMEANAWFPGVAVAPFLPAPPPPAPGKRPTGPFSLADPDDVTALLEGSGWTGVHRHPYELVVVVERDAIADKGHMRLQGVAEQDLERAWDALSAALAPLVRPDGRCDAPIAFQIFTAHA